MPNTTLWQWKHEAYVSDLLDTEEQAMKDAGRASTGGGDEDIAVRRLSAGPWVPVDFNGYKYTVGDLVKHTFQKQETVGKVIAVGDGGVTVERFNDTNTYVWLFSEISMLARGYWK
jgi:hypothetical protein